MRYNTIILDQAKWDMVLDTSGNIAIAKPPYALAQDVASAIKLFKGELWYDTSKGIPYFKEILGLLPPVSLIIEYMKLAALAVPGVESVQINMNQFSNIDRIASGEVLFIDEEGVENGVFF
jgi:hypothetical protein